MYLGNRMKVCFTLLFLLLVMHIGLSVVGSDYGRDRKRKVQRHESLPSTPTDVLTPFTEDSRLERSISNTTKKNFTHFYEVSQPNDREWPHVQTLHFIDSTKDANRWALGTVTYIDSPRTTFSVLEPFQPGSCNSVWPIRSTVQTTASTREGGCLVAQNGGFFRMSSSECLGNIISDGQFVRESDHVVNANFGIKASGQIFVGYLSNEEVKNKTDPFIQLLSGVIWLVKNGTNFVNESMHIESANNEGTGNMEEFVNVVSARTALGHDKLGRVMMLEVDGQTHKRGVNLFELADILIEQGAVNAINLDGGGSATVVEEGILGNHVSDHCPRNPEYRCMRAVSTVVCAHDVSCVPQDCHKHGECVEGVCNCTSPWTGLGCSQLLCSNSTCGGHGGCVGEGRCECDDGWTGELCEHTCPRYYYGPNCQLYCWCSKYGYCHPSTGACVCAHGYEGENCGNTCSEGRYGHECGEVCECSDNAVCDHVLGCVVQNMTSQTTSTDAGSATNTTSAAQAISKQIVVTELPYEDAGVTESPTDTTTTQTVGEKITTENPTPSTVKPTSYPNAIDENIIAENPTPSIVQPTTVQPTAAIESTEAEVVVQESMLNTLLQHMGINISTPCLHPLLLSYLPLVLCSVLSNILICFLSWLYWGGRGSRKLKRKSRQQRTRNITMSQLKSKDGFLHKMTRASPVSYEPVSTQLGNESTESSS